MSPPTHQILILLDLTTQVIRGDRHISAAELKTSMRKLYMTRSDDQLSVRSLQRQLVLVSALLFASLVLLSSLYHEKTREGWSALDAIYFTVMTFTTIGFGDTLPQSL